MSSQQQRQTPDPTNGLVTVPTAETGGKKYHTRECSYYPGSAKLRRMSRLPDGYKPCQHCTRTVDTSNATSVLECPFCGETTRLRDHLPCEESP